ncbi:hypothetical protein QR680_017282 [Steinernema hermaphroditum]|uniref:Alpha-1,3-glucosyltransferase n=1 Tax=Steinernema hermaphroditum TaxID=289476 RepID=A0AA39LND5_9BILA|nr:hypothetical protein QR680_017282 [Steinernema hermaphroditum]
MASLQSVPFAAAMESGGFRAHLAIVVAVVTLKCALLDSYTSTDFEVHRNWMAITHHLPLAEWYRSAVSEWTLDYPPFFAYFEWLLARVAAVVDSRILVLHAEPFFSASTLYFQRFSVIFTDLFYIAAAWLCVRCVVSSLQWPSDKHAARLKFVGFVLLASNPALILIDNVHFQYNSMLTAWLLLSVASIASGRPLLGALFFSVLLNFKHLYLYYVPAYVAHYLVAFLLPLDKAFVGRFVKLALAVGGPLVASFGPFLLAGSFELLGQILSRLFPFHRGLTHALWAPNFWAIYNAADFVAFQVARCFPNLLPFVPTLSQYTSGLVKEYSHSVLWNVSPLATLSLILMALTPLVYRRMKNPRGDIVVDMVLCSFAFFFFGWHVHEKAILMISVPLTVLALKDYRYVSCFVLLCVSGYTSILPLFFTPLESCFKYAFLSFVILLHISLLMSTLKIASSAVVPFLDRLYIAGLVATEIYKCTLHEVIFRGSMPFLPIMVTSIYCAVGVSLAYVRFLRVTYRGDHCEPLKAECIRFEEKCKAKSSMSLINEAGVRYIGGIDISTCKTNNSLAVVSYTVLSYPDLQVIHEMDEIEYIPYPYINSFLAVREAEPMSRLILKCSRMHPETKADVVLVDANGKYHSREFGLACHIGHRCGIPTIGVSKSLNLSPLIDSRAPKDELKNLEKEVTKMSEARKTPGPFRLPFSENLQAVKTQNSKVPLFVSVGYGIDLEEAGKIVYRSAVSRIPQPIHLSDLRSRELVREYYENPS